MTEKIHIDVYLSYRSHYQTQLQQLIDSAEDYNNDDNVKYYITIKASESELNKGESIFEFMEELSAARFVLLMQTKDYFQSPYCLHELLEIHENGGAEQRILPISIKLDDTVHEVTADLIDDYLDADFKIDEEVAVHCLSRLRELQEDAGPRQTEIDQLRLRLKAAYESQVKNSLIYQLEEEAGDILQTIVDKAELVFQEEKQEHHEHLTEQIRQQLHQLKQEDLEALMLEMGKLFDEDGRNQKIATHLLDQTVDKTMTVMQKWVKAQNKNITERFAWRLFFQKVENICGWLLLNSIDNNWWIHNRINLLKRCRDQNQISLGINKPAYAEVVIGRTLKQAAMFSLDDYHNPIPQVFEDTWSGFQAGSEGNVSFKNDFVIDASSSAQTEELLKPLIYDLKQKPPKISDSLSVQMNELIDEIRASSKEQVFYLVTEGYHQKLKELKIDGISILDKINTELKEKLVFISFGSTEDSTHQVSHDENVLTQFATILRTDKTRKQGSN